MMTTATADTMTDAFKQATEVFNQTLSTGMKFQEETTRFWNDTCGKSMDQFCGEAEKFSRETIPTAKRNMERMHKTFDEQARKNMDMVRKSFETAEATLDQSFMDKTFDLWRSSIETFRTSMETMAKANMRLFDGWGEMAHRCSESGPGGMKPAAVKHNGK
ncbi:MAG: hypothetical protein HOP29_20240 [Phycisphaerales bacterium]|nr:hypothetical protein [Phycisphaerales bacterium]